MRVLMIGDVIGRPGRHAIKELVPGLRERHRCDLVVANVENAAAGFGITEPIGREILASGVDVMTGGNHLWDKKGSEDYIASEEMLVRPANYPDATPGRTHAIVEVGDIRVAVLSLQGRVFMPPLDCPFRRLDSLLEELDEAADLFLLDFHGEATSEKNGMAVYADGRVALVVGTHTHVPTADERILPGGTAFQTDLGMTGPFDSIIGMDREAVLKRFLTGMPTRFEVAQHDVRLCGLVVEIDEWSGQATSVTRVMESWNG
ncbi:TIGR00282 family metallophosphoesterase [bacterium]|nr:MAG: TIGR00282 family metallophosphoesterase [bacterium]RKZ16881.1 MAG: TIGR00282 family metallophosphoesterase [bacterium]